MAVLDRLKTFQSTGKVLTIDVVSGIVYANGVPINVPGGGISLEVNGVANTVQSLLDLVNGTNVSITDNGDGSVTINATGLGDPGATGIPKRTTLGVTVPADASALSAPMYAGL